MRLGKRIMIIVLSMVLCLGVAAAFTGCGDKKTVLKVFAHEGAYGKAFWTQIEKDFEKLNSTVDVQITALPSIDKSLEAALGTKQTYPDVVYYGTNQASGFVGKNIIKTAADTLLMDLSEVLDTNIPGENIKLKDKIDPNFLNTSATSPFAGDTKTYMLPLFYTVNGIYYNKTLLGDQAVPKTIAEMAAVTPTVSTAKVFGYPRGGYTDNFNIAAAKSTLSDADFKLWLSNGYSETMYAEDGSYKEFFTSLDSLKGGFMSEFAVTQANMDDVKTNTKAFYDGKVAFFVGGSMMPSDAKGWKVLDSAAIDTFNKDNAGFMPFPTVTATQKQYFVSMIEQVYPLKTGNEAKEKLAKEFSAYLFSDAATKIIAANNAMVPTTNRNEIATAAKMDAFTQSLFGVMGDPIFAALPTGAVAIEDKPAGLWHLAYKQVSCFGINKVMGSTFDGGDNADAPSDGAGLFAELKLWAKAFNKIK